MTFFIPKFENVIFSIYQICDWPWMAVWPDWAVYWTLGIFTKPLATINLPKSPTFLGNFCEIVKIFKFFQWIHFWATFIDIGWLFTGHTGGWTCSTFLCLWVNVSPMVNVKCSSSRRRWMLRWPSRWAEIRVKIEKIVYTTL